MKKIWVWVLIAFVFLAFFCKAFIFLDPDFGWHYQMGKVIVESGIPKSDPFSYTMPGFKYVDHEWLTNILIFKIYSIFGYAGLSLLWSLMMIGILIISITTFGITKQNISDADSLFPIKAGVFILGAGMFLYQFGVRPQVVSWLFLSFLIWVFKNWDKKPKVKYLTPLLFLIWANIHGMFALGIIILALYLTTKCISNKRVNVSDVLIFISSVFVTLVNPYGILIWKEILATFFDYTSRTQILEWKPVWARLNLFYPTASLLGLVLCVRYKKSLKPEFIIIFLVLLVMSINSLISLPLFGIISIPILISGLALLTRQVSTLKYGKERFGKVMKIFIGLMAVFCIFGIYSAIGEAYRLSETEYYPKTAVTFAGENLTTGEIFAPFNWGGYLIWKLPQKKVFVDGRMVHWDGILDYQTKIVTGETDYKEAFNKYNITAVLWPKNTNRKVFVDRIKQDGWKVVYSDSVAEIFERQH